MDTVFVSADKNEKYLFTNQSLFVLSLHKIKLKMQKFQLAKLKIFLSFAGKYFASNENFKKIYTWAFP